MKHTQEWCIGKILLVALRKRMMDDNNAFFGVD